MRLLIIIFIFCYPFTANSNDQVFGYVDLKYILKNSLPSKKLQIEMDKGRNLFQKSINQKELRMSFGYGFQWETPIGPLSFTWADAVKKESYDQLQRFEFRLGSHF